MDTGEHPGVDRLRSHVNFAVSEAPAAISKSTLDGLARQSTVEKIRSEPETTVNSCWLVPTFRTHGVGPAFVTVKDKMGFSLAAYRFLSVELDTRTLPGAHAWAAAVALGEADAEAVPEAVPVALPLALPEAEPEAPPVAEPEAASVAELLAPGVPLSEADCEGSGEEALGEGVGATEAGGVVLGADSLPDFLPNSAPNAALTPQIMSTMTRTAAMSATQRRRA